MILADDVLRWNSCVVSFGNFVSGLVVRQIHVGIYWIAMVVHDFVLRFGRVVIFKSFRRTFVV